MQFELLKEDGGARRGRLTFVRGTVETPAFMPVGTYGSVKAMTPEELERLGAEIGQSDFAGLARGHAAQLELRRGASKCDYLLSDDLDTIEEGQLRRRGAACPWREFEDELVADLDAAELF